LMKFRYGEKILVEWAIPEELLEVRVPYLFLQPLIENSFQHGFSQKRPPWWIKVSASLREGLWSFCLEDDGCGLREESLRRVQEDGQSVSQPNLPGGVGIPNIVGRFRLLYSETFSWSITNRNPGCRIELMGIGAGHA